MISIPKLKDWFLEEKRDLPWRVSPTPYAVWVSEVMLQQTQVSVVIPYFERWMKRFPTIEDLAKAPLDQVIKLWEGLGYYSRARNLHEGAKVVVEAYDGKLPGEESKLSKIRGLGPYTIGAIRSFAFHHKVPAVDGNVLRVISRYFLIEEDISKAKTIDKIRNRVENFLPDQESWIINEALIELGATVCNKKPKCQECPIRMGCKAYQQGLSEKLPVKSKQQATIHLYRAVPVIHYKDFFLVRRGNQGEIMQDLHEFPYIETSKKGLKPSDVQEKLKERWNLSVKYHQSLSEINHTFTKYKVRLFPMRFLATESCPIEGYEWKLRAELEQLAFSSGHRKIFLELAS